jgi:hypothetical protein
MFSGNVEAELSASFDGAGMAHRQHFDRVAFPGNLIGLDVPQIGGLIDARENADQIERLAFHGNRRVLSVMQRQRFTAGAAGHGFGEGSQGWRGRHEGNIHERQWRVRVQA